MSRAVLALQHVILASETFPVFIAAGKFTAWSKVPSLKVPFPKSLGDRGYFLP